MAGDFICVYTNNKYNIACTWPHDDTKFTVHFLQQIHKTPNPFFFLVIYIKGIFHVDGTTRGEKCNLTYITIKLHLVT